MSWAAVFKHVRMGQRVTVRNNPGAGLALECTPRIGTLEQSSLQTQIKSAPLGSCIPFQELRLRRALDRLQRKAVRMIESLEDNTSESRLKDTGLAPTSRAF